MTQNEATQVKDTTIIRAQTQSSDAMMREQNATNGNGHAFPLQYDAASTRWVLYNYYSGISKAMRSFSALYFRFSLGHFDFDLLKNKKKTMASMYSRRPRGGGGNPLPPSYRNKALLIIAAIAVYTAFLYHSGK